MVDCGIVALGKFVPVCNLPMQEDASFDTYDRTAYDDFLIRKQPPNSTERCAGSAKLPAPVIGVLILCKFRQRQQQQQNGEYQKRREKFQKVYSSRASQYCL